MISPPFFAAQAMDTPTKVLLVVGAVVAVLAIYPVHLGLHRFYLSLARRYCAKHGFEISRWRMGPEFDDTGVKTEFTLVELDCLTGQQERRLIRLRIWIFGVRKVLANEPFPASLEE